MTLTGADLGGATLTGVASGGIAGTAAALPVNWVQAGGYLIGPGWSASRRTLTTSPLAH